MGRYLVITIAVLAVIFSASIVPSILHAQQEQAVTDCRGREQECTAAVVEEKLFGPKVQRRPYVPQSQSPSVEQVRTPPQETGPVILPIFFKPNSDRVSPESKDQIKKIVTAMTNRSGRHVWIEGHTDSDGPADYNLKLSKRRAQSVKDS
jgi:outer membrane protein OmpA-like peptidoglycan-associated protein